MRYMKARKLSKFIMVNNEAVTCVSLNPPSLYKPFVQDRLHGHAHGLQVKVLVEGSGYIFSI